MRLDATCQSRLSQSGKASKDICVGVSAVPPEMRAHHVPHLHTSFRRDFTLAWPKYEPQVCLKCQRVFARPQRS
jgi:hypothetical protein